MKQKGSLKRFSGLTLPLTLAACGGGGAGPKPVQPTPNKAPTDITLSAATIDENISEATVIGTLTTIDSDDTVHTYTISDDRFEVVSGELRLKAGNNLNHEVIQGSGSDAVISIDITTTDPDGLIYTETFTITVTDVNEAPTAIALSNASVAENAEAALIGTLSTEDVDDGDTFTYTVSDDRFEVVSGELRLKAGISLDYEVASTVDIDVTVTDSDGLSFTETFTVTVTDVDDPLVVSGAAAIAGLENSTQIITSAELLANTAGDAPVVSGVTVSAGILVDNGDGTWTYTPDANWHGEVTLSYTVTDGAETTVATATLSIEEKTFTIPFGDFAGTVLHFNDPLLEFQSNLLGYSWNGAWEYIPAPHINIIPVWEEYSGVGIRIGTNETVDTTHPELAETYLRELYSTYDPNLAFADLNYHGTATAGIISAGADNGIGLVGIAYGARITSYDTGEEIGDRFDIITNSTGSSSSIFFSIGFKENADNLAPVVLTGRGGLGTIHVISVGNGGANDHTTETSGYNNLFELMPVGLIDVHGYAYLTDYGSGVHISAPITSFGEVARAITIDRTGDLGMISIASHTTVHSSFDPYDFFPYHEALGYDLVKLGLDTGDYTTLGGSSAAAPTVAGGVALMLEASGNNIFGLSGLGWRDVQEILALSARHSGTGFGDWTPDNFEHHPWTINGATNFNGGGMHFAPDYGFGMLDVHAAVRLAETWTLQHTSANLVISDMVVTSAETITFGAAIEISIDMTGSADLDLDVVSIDLDITHDNWSELQITLISPDGTESIIFDTPGLTAGNTNDNPMTGQLIWTVLSRAFWGENTDGVWAIRIEDVVDNGNSGSVGSITAHFQGDVATDADTYLFTDDWQIMNDANGGIPVLDDAVGINTINSAAVSDDVMLDMSAGAMSQIGGVDAFSLSATTGITVGITGDGNDTITGLNAGDSAYAMRGDDRIEITNTDFAVIDGYRGNDTLALMGDGMVLDFSTLTGTITGIENIDLTASGAQSLIFTAVDVTALSDSTDALYITGNSDDQVRSVGEGWVLDGTTTLDDITYNIYTLGTATLYVDAGIWQDVG